MGSLEWYEVHEEPAAKVAARPMPTTTSGWDENKVQTLAVDVAGSRAPAFCVMGTVSPISAAVTPNQSRAPPKERPCINPPRPGMLCGGSYVVTTSVTGARGAIRGGASLVRWVGTMCVRLPLM